jgi:cell wall-associated NlpC family hydrolase
MSASRRHLLAVPLAAAVFAIGADGTAPAQSLSAKREALQAQVAAETRRIEATSAGLADAEARLSELNERVALRTSQMRQAQSDLVNARIALAKLERRAEESTRTLSANLVDTYKAGEPSLVNVVLDSNGFQDLLERLNFVRRVETRNARILDDVRDARADVADQADELADDRKRYAELADTAIADRERADVLATALLNRQADQLAQRAGTAAELREVRTRIARIEAAQAAAARRAAAAPTASQDAPAPPAAVSDPSGAVAKVIAAANEIASTPYVYGGGHGGSSGGYDCSGSISYALAAAGLVSGSLTSGGFMSWGEPGVGQHITVYANYGHAYMVVDGRRFDTSALSGGGTRWTSVMRSSAGFVARHPPGL